MNESVQHARTTHPLLPSPPPPPPSTSVVPLKSESKANDLSNSYDQENVKRRAPCAAAAAVLWRKRRVRPQPGGIESFALLSEATRLPAASVRCTAAACSISPQHSSTRSATMVRAPLFCSYLVSCLFVCLFVLGFLPSKVVPSCCCWGILEQMLVFLINHLQIISIKVILWEVACVVCCCAEL